MTVPIRSGDIIPAAGLIPEQWQTLPLLNGWAARGGYYIPSFRKVPGGEVELIGAAIGGTNTNGTVVASLPDGYRPASLISAPLATNRGYTVVLNVDPNGEITLAHVLADAPTALYFFGRFPLSLS